jgi:hypothetical protein
LSSFEFAQIPMAIILGFGITEILASSGYQLRNRGRAPWSPLLCLVIIRYRAGFASFSGGIGAETIVR